MELVKAHITMLGHQRRVRLHRYRHQAQPQITFPAWTGNHWMFRFPWSSQHGEFMLALLAKADAEANDEPQRLRMRRARSQPDLRALNLAVC